MGGYDEAVHVHYCGIKDSVFPREIKLLLSREDSMTC
jgi:hypothetical protein